MEKNVLVSILVPVYNREKWIKDCLNSLINQTYDNIEIIVYDDGSEDNSLNIINSYMRQDARIHLIVAENHKGVSEARMQLLKNYKGKYVFFVDSDDVIDTKAVEKAVAIMEKEKVDLVFFRFRLNKGVYCIPQIKRYLPNGKHSIEFVKKYYFKNPVNLFYSSLCNKCYRASILEQCGYNFESVMEDVFFNIEYLSRVHICYVMPDFFYTYNQTNESMTRKTKKKRFVEAHLERWMVDKTIFERIRSAFKIFSDRELKVLEKYFYIRYAREKKISLLKNDIANEFLKNIGVPLKHNHIRFFCWNLIVYKENTKQVLKQFIKKMMKIH